MRPAFATKDEARTWVWDRLQADKAARFPFPPHGRIPNFAGAERAAERLMEQPEIGRARRIKVNPDAAQRPVRQLALARGITVFMPTPRLRGGFILLDPARIPPGERARAAGLGAGMRWGRTVALRELPPMDAIVTGSVAVTPRGRRCGKGHGYGDLEYAILRELGHAPVKVFTTVHPIQIVRDFPVDAHDLPVEVIVTTDEVLRVESPPPAPNGIAWDRLAPSAFDAMPILAELRRALGRAPSR